MKLGQRGTSGHGTRRRAVIRTALAGVGGLAASGLLPPLAAEAYAAPADPGAGARRHPQPHRGAIEPSGLAVELIHFSTPPRTSATPLRAPQLPLPRGDGSRFVYACDGRGKIWRIDPAGTARLFLDVKRRAPAPCCSS
jgi:hypothetical protein